MTLTLTEDLSRAVEASADQPVRLIDPKTNEVFVLIRADAYDRVRTLMGEDFDIRESYAAQIDTAMRAGWGDPVMDDYDRYDDA